MSYLNSYYAPTPPVNTAHNLNVVYINQLPVAVQGNIFMAWQMAQVNGATTVINTPYYVAPDTYNGAHMPSILDILKPAPKPVYDARYALLVGLNAPNGLIVYPIQL